MKKNTIIKIVLIFILIVIATGLLYISLIQNSVEVPSSTFSSESTHILNDTNDHNLSEPASTVNLGVVDSLKDDVKDGGGNVAIIPNSTDEVKNKYDGSELIGFWARKGESHYYFYVDERYFHYPNNQNYEYEVEILDDDQSVLIKQPDLAYYHGYSINGDTLNLNSLWGFEEFVRWCPETNSVCSN